LFGLIAPVAWAQNTVQTIAGGGPNNLPALKASMGSPTSVTLDSVGNLYVTDINSNRVFKVATTGVVTVVAGNGQHGGFTTGDGGPAIAGTLTDPNGAAVDSSGNLFIADKTYCRIREVSAQTGNISTIAGTGGCLYSGDGGPATSAALIGCGGGGSTVLPPPSGGTPAGNYMLTVTASSGGVSHTTQLTLIVTAAQ
jgi:hypothetical protein